MPTVLWQRDVPEAIRCLSTLANPDDADIFTATTSGSTNRSAEQFVRAEAEGVPLPLRLFSLLAQRLLLGFRLESEPSPNHVLGWKIADRWLGWKIADPGESWIRIEAASWFLTAQAVFHKDERQASLAAFVRYDRRIAALVWPPVSLIHRHVGIALVRHAERAL